MTTIQSIDARFAQTQVSGSNAGVRAAVQNLATGRKVDANVADLSVGTVLATRVGTLRVAVGNAGQATSLLETAKGALDTILTLLQQQKNLAVKSADDSLSDNERGFLNQEFQAIVSEINRISENANFNGKALLDGSISGTAGFLTSTLTTNEAVENFSVTATSDYALRGNSDALTTGPLNTTASSAFGVVTANSIGDTRGEAILSFSAAATGAGTGATIQVGGAVNLAFTYTDAGSAALNTIEAAEAFVAVARASTNATVRNFLFKHIGAGQILIRAAAEGTAANDISFQLTDDGGDGTNDGLLANTTTLGGTDIDANGGATTGAFSNVTTAVLGSVRTVDFADQKFDTDLIGAISNVTARFEPGGVENGTTNSVVFTVDVGGTTYTSQAVALYGTGGYNSNGATIIAGQDITFFDLNGDSDSDGELVESGFTLTIGSSDVAVSGSTVITAQDSLNTIAANIETQLQSVAITQDRNPALAVTSATDPDITSAAGTFLVGIHGFNATDANPAPGTQGDIILRSDGYITDGSHGSIGKFQFDRNTGILSTTIGGVAYSANLASTTDTTTSTGQGYYAAGNGAATAYNTSTGVFITNGVIVLATADTTDGRQLRIDLDTNINNSATADTTLNINSADDELEFEAAFNKLFGVSDNESLSFQVGASAADSIGVSIGSAKTSDIYKDATGAPVELTIANITASQTASDVLDIAINNVISLLADVSAAITSFNSAIQNNQASIQNADAARSKLLDTDFTVESTKFAEARVKVDAATAVLTQINSRIQNLLQLLQQ